MFQSTHPHGVRHGGFYRLKPTPRVSIHAPTWGATELPEEFVNYMTVSIHAPTWGATQQANGKRAACRFQSTHPHGVRPIIAVTRVLVCACFNPRTHMGCDDTLKAQTSAIFSFNPRTHMGCDSCEFDLNMFGVEFQSTHPHGVRPI